MSGSESELLKFVHDRLRHQFDVKRIVLFGSRATDAANADSDFDVLVVANSDIPVQEQLQAPQTP